MKTSNFSQQFKYFEKDIEESFIEPKNIQKKDYKASLYNMLPYNPNPKNIKTINAQNVYISSEEFNQKNLHSDSQKTSKENNFSSNIIFGQHKTNSFYESYAREIIFQLFQYPLMSYHKYKLLLEKSDEYNGICQWVYKMNKKEKGNPLDNIEKRKGGNDENDNISLLHFLKKYKLNFCKKEYNIDEKNKSDDTSLKRENIYIGRTNIIKISKKEQKLISKSKYGNKRKTSYENNFLNNGKENEKREKKLKEEKSIQKILEIGKDTLATGKIPEKEEKKITDKIKRDEEKINLNSDKKNEISTNDLDIKANEKLNEKEKKDLIIENNNKASAKEKNESKKIQKRKSEITKDKNIIYDRKNQFLKKNKSNLSGKQLQIKKQKSLPKQKCSTSKEFTKETALLDLIAYSDEDIKKIKIFEKEEINGDFDFLIHSLDGKVLQDVLTNKDISPFIFFGNFKINKDIKYDIIGEIKESTDSHEKLVEQASKYIKLIYNLNKDKGKLNEKLCFKKENKKIIMYVLNNEYNHFIKDILDFRINQDKFREMKNFENNKNYKEIVSSFDQKKYKRKNMLMNLIIMSDIPFIFIFVQNLIKLKEIKEKINQNLNDQVNLLTNKTKELEEKLAANEIELINEIKNIKKIFAEEINKKNLEIVNLMTQQKKESDDLKKKILELENKIAQMNK